MWKMITAGVTMLAIAGSSMVYAQQRDAARGPRHQMSAADISAYTDARIAGLKAGLKLTAEQEKNWPALEKALRDRAKIRADRFAARASADKPRDLVERLRTRAEAMTERGTALKQVADAAAPLYQSLDDAQKSRFARLAQLDGPRFGNHPHGPHHGGHRGMMHKRGPAGAEDAPTQQ